MALAPARRCRPYHRSCSQHHADLVDGYVLERQRQEMIADELYPSERQLHLERNPLITFKVWLINSKVNQCPHR